MKHVYRRSADRNLFLAHPYLRKTLATLFTTMLTGKNQFAR